MLIINLEQERIIRRLEHEQKDIEETMDGLIKDLKHSKKINKELNKTNEYIFASRDETESKIAKILEEQNIDKQQINGK